MKKKLNKIFFLCSVSTGFDLIKLSLNKIPISGVIGINYNKYKNQNLQISGIINIKKKCQDFRIPYHQVNDYNLKNKKDVSIIKKLNIDLLVVSGWQRLIPLEVLNLIKYGTIGFHGSPYGINKGRGRSPQNWSLIMGSKQFTTSIFLLNKFQDSGDIIETNFFKLTKDDDITTSYLKSVFIASKLLVKYISNDRLLKTKKIKQNLSPKYFPKRQPEDGQIDWNRKAEKIKSFVAALTHPYPGAYTILNEIKIIVWKIKLLDFKLSKKYKNGQIIYVTHDNKIIVNCNKKQIIIDEYELEKKINLNNIINNVFDRVSIKKQIKTIVDRHYNKYPKLIIHPSINKIV